MATGPGELAHCPLSRRFCRDQRSVTQSYLKLCFHRLSFIEAELKRHKIAHRKDDNAWPLHAAAVQPSRMARLALS
jgi:hypothetical protein